MSALDEKDFARIDRALAYVIENPEGFSEFELDFADRNADRLGRYGPRTHMSRSQWLVVEAIELKMGEQS